MLPLCFLDVETTGTNPSYNRIIEIGILKVIDGKIVEKFESLINPESGISQFITNITGIDEKMLDTAPTFYEIKDDLINILSGSILVAHNARFDYGFLRNEFKRLDTSFSAKHMCSIKLARQLFPGLDYYNLDSIISKFGIKCERRHRAFDDAKAIYDFYKIAKKSVTQEEFTCAIDFALKKPSIPINISSETLEALPESPGVYIFLGEDDYPLYIGKSINIRDRVLSHFSNDHHSITDLQISQEIRNIKTVRTAGELGALLLESTLIKKFQPLYNKMLRDARKMILLLSDQNALGYSTVSIKEVDKIDPHDTDKIIGIFKSRKQLREHLHELSKQFNLCPKIMGLDHSKKNCFYYHLKICLGACSQKEDSIAYNMRFTQAFFKYKMKRWIYDSPVLIKEESDIEEAFVIDKWCLLGSIKSEDEFSNLQIDYSFDLDTYKILSKYLLNPPRNISIKKIDLGNVGFETV